MGVDTKGYIRNGISPEEVAWKIEKYIRPSKLSIVENTLVEEGPLDSEHIMLEGHSIRWHRYALIDFTSASGADFRLTYIYSNNTYLGELQRSIMYDPEHVPALTTHSVHLIFGAREESQKMMKRIVALFGGYYVQNDCNNEIAYVPQRDKCKE